MLSRTQLYAAVDAWCRATLGGMLGPADTESDAGLVSRVLHDDWCLAPFLGVCGLSETLASAGKTVDWEASGGGVDLVMGGLVRAREASREGDDDGWRVS